MKKRIAVLVLIIMVWTLIPVATTAATAIHKGEIGFLYVGGHRVATQSGILVDSEGEGWSYSAGRLVLHDYNGGPILIGGMDSSSDLIIELQGRNTIEVGAIPAGTLGFSGNEKPGIIGFAVNLTFTRKGQLNLMGDAGYSMAPIMINNGTVIFDLSVGGKVSVDAVPHPERFTPGGIIVSNRVDGMTGTADMITLVNGNFVEMPAGCSPGIWEILRPGQRGTEKQGETPPSPQVKDSPADQIISYATILTCGATDGSPADIFIISGPLPMEETTEEPTAAEPDIVKPVGTVTKAETPKTGDESMAGIAIAIMVLSGVGCIGMAKKRVG